MTLEQWMKEARRAAKHLWCYEELVDDHPELVQAGWETGRDPIEFVQWLGDKYDLTPAIKGIW